MVFGKNDERRANTEEVAQWKDDGWHVGPHGPFQMPHAAFRTADGTCCVIAKKVGQSAFTVLVDRIPRGEFESYDRIDTPSGNFQLHARTLTPTEPGTTSSGRYTFVLYKKMTHGPFDIFAHEKEIAPGLCHGRLASGRPNVPGEKSMTFFDGTAYGPYPHSAFTLSEKAGATYLFCPVGERGAGHLCFGKRGRICTFEEFGTNDRGKYDRKGTCIVGRESDTGSSSLTVLYGGDAIANLPGAVSIDEAIPLGRNLIMVVRRKEKGDKETVTVYRNAVSVSGPFEEIRDLVVREDGHLTFLSVTTDRYGNRRLSLNETKVLPDI